MFKFAISGVSTDTKQYSSISDKASSSSSGSE